MTQPQPDRRAGVPPEALVVSCQHCSENLLDYVEGVLPAGERAHFDAHLAHCPDCRTYLGNYKQAAALVAGLAQHQTSDSASPRGDALGSPTAVPSLIESILRARHRC